MTAEAGLPSLLPVYTILKSGDLLTALGDDAIKWAAAFCQHAKKLGYGDIDEGWMMGWFANAIEHSSDVRRWEREKSTPPSVSPTAGLIGELKNMRKSKADVVIGKTLLHEIISALAPTDEIRALDFDTDWFVVSEAVIEAVGNGEGQAGPRGLEAAFARYGLVVGHKP